MLGTGKPDGRPGRRASRTPTGHPTVRRLGRPPLSAKPGTPCGPVLWRCTVPSCLHGWPSLKSLAVKVGSWRKVLSPRWRGPCRWSVRSSGWTKCAGRASRSSCFGPSSPWAGIRWWWGPARPGFSATPRRTRCWLSWRFVTILLPQPGPEFVPLGEWVYMSGSGQVMLCSLDGPELRLDLAADTAYVLRRWRKGGDSAAERFEELAGGSSTSASPRPAPTRPATNPLWTRSVNSATRGASA